MFDKIDDPDYITLLKELGVDSLDTADLLKRLQDRRKNLNTTSQKLGNMLQNRKGRLQMQQPSDEELQGLTDKEKQNLLDVHLAQTDADRSSEESALMASWKELEKAHLRQEQEEALREMLKSLSKSECDKILCAHNNELRQLESKRNLEQYRQQDKLTAKLAARKRLREQLDRDKVVNKELDHITKMHVSTYFVLVLVSF